MKQDNSKRDAKIYRLFEIDGYRQKTIAKIYGLSEGRIKKIIGNERKKHV